MLDTIDVDLAGTRVLDVGCNRGGFLRLLADNCGIKEGLGYDPAAGAIEDARRLAGTRPLRFEAAAAPPAAWSGFDAAFSHEVLYLLDDLPVHATAIFRTLKPGGVYYAVMGVHAASPLTATWHAENLEEMCLPALYDLDQVAAWFSDAGFEVAASRLRVRFVSHRRSAPQRRSVTRLARLRLLLLLLLLLLQPEDLALLQPPRVSGAQLGGCLTRMPYRRATPVNRSLDA